MTETTKITILLVEDDASIRELLCQNLEYEGYHVIASIDGKTGLELATSAHPDLILLDLMLPVQSGLDLCKQLRATGSDVPIIMLTARNATHDIVKGLREGADDYLTKPFDLLELLARIETVLRRKQKVVSFQDQYSIGDVSLCFSERKVIVRNHSSELSQQEAMLLRYLMHNHGMVLSREQIFDDVWGHQDLYSFRTIDTHINKLRKKIELVPGKPQHIVTVHRVGYRFEGS